MLDVGVEFGIELDSVGSDDFEAFPALTLHPIAGNSLRSRLTPQSLAPGLDIADSTAGW